MSHAVNLGMPRIGPDRELKRAVEGYWAGTVDRDGLQAAARARRADGWAAQRAAGIEGIPSNDFSLYDQVLDACCLVGAVPPRFGAPDGDVDLDTYFAMARGTDGPDGPVAPMEMTKWFDTNYHYLVPEIGPDTTFRPSPAKPVAELREAQALGIATRPVLVGPVTFLLAATSTGADLAFDPLDRLGDLLPAYAAVLADLAAAGAEWIQLDEPFLVTELDEATRRSYREAYAALAAASPARLLLATYFGGLGGNVDLVASLPVDGVHVDLVRDPGQLDDVLDRLPPDRVLSVGAVDGRNVWRTDLRAAADALVEAEECLGERLWVAPSCSLLHVPHDLDLEPDLDPELRGWLAFARQKLDEVATLAAALAEGPDAESVADALAASDAAVRGRRASAATTAPDVRSRTASVGPGDATRPGSAAERAAVQARALGLPLLPTTTIGSFPQTPEIRRARRRHAAGELTGAEYRSFCEAEVASVVARQEAIGLDVLVHGEPERNDMVQYFGERLRGFATTRAAWVQSYGTRCVRPPILYGDVARDAPMTVAWTRYAQALTARPVKGMLTGPVTILQWSFVRDDIPRSESCRQIALAVRDEVDELEAAGTQIIQVDEPALREGLPLRASERAAYLDWATECFRLATSGVADATQIHTHMCYAEFGDIVAAIVALDADVISIEAARSRMEVLDDLAAARYPAGVGPGVYDIHSPNVPSADEVADLLARAQEVLPAAQLWVNPDCGLKTRGWDEVTPALENMVAAALAARARLADPVPAA